MTQRKPIIVLAQIGDKPAIVVAFIKLTGYFLFKAEAVLVDLGRNRLGNF